jgi:hypothetical protein
VRRVVTVRSQHRARRGGSANRVARIRARSVSAGRRGRWRRRGGWHSATWRRCRGGWRR